MSDTAAYVLNLIGADGELERRIERGPAPRAVTDADREAGRERLRSESGSGMQIRIGGAGPDEEVQRKLTEQRIASMTFAELVPRIVRLRVDDRDRIWVAVSEAGRTWPPGSTSTTGRARSWATCATSGSRTSSSGGGRAAYVQRDELDVQQLVVVEVAQEQPAG